ncbi:MAG: hypothetical protein ABSB59_09390 [Streptosporangiaceae bacterium]
MPTDAAQDAWADYRQAIERLYQPGEQDQQDRGDAGLRVDRLDDVVVSSGRLRAELAASLTAEDLGERELTALKLVAAAAYDLSVAADAALTDEEGPAATGDRAAASEVLTDPGLRRILEAPPGADTLTVVTVDRRARASDPVEAASELSDEIAGFLDEIPERTAKTSLQSVTGLAGLADNLLLGAVSLPVPDMLATVPDHTSGLLHRAARLVTEALAKLLAAIGGEHGADVREAAYEWFAEIKGVEKLVAGLLGRLYEVDRIRAEVDLLLEHASGVADAGQYNRAIDALEDLLARYDTTIKTVTWVLRALSLVKRPLLGAVPWGPVVVGSCYIGALGYVVYAGGDYLDWYRLGETAWLDRVHGLRAAVHDAFAAP